jgi:hypothetical protein
MQTRAKKTLKIEIIFILIVKILFLYGLYLLCFSHPTIVNKQKVSSHILEDIPQGEN